MCVSNPFSPRPQTGTSDGESVSPFACPQQLKRKGSQTEQLNPPTPAPSRPSASLWQHLPSRCLGQKLWNHPLCFTFYHTSKLSLNRSTFEIFPEPDQSSPPVQLDPGPRPCHLCSELRHLSSWPCPVSAQRPQRPC